MKLTLEIITPTGVLLNEDIESLTLPTENGELTILPGHVSLVTKIRPGEMVIRRNGKEDLFAILGGFLDISDNHVNILADHAIRAEDIEITRAQAAEERAKQAMKNKTNEHEFRVAQNELGKALLELKVARKHKARRS